MDYHPLEGHLVCLRAREPEDEPLLHQWFNDPEVTENLVIRYPLSHAQEKAFITSVDAPSFARAGFAVVAKDTGELIGGADLVDSSSENRSAELGIAIGDKARWDGGYGTDTMRTLCRFGFDFMNLNRIELEVYLSNPRAIHVYETVGFVREGVRREAMYKYGRYLDVLVMGLLRGELRME